MQQIVSTLTDLIKSVMCSVPLEQQSVQALADETFVGKLYSIASEQDIAHIVGTALLEHKDIVGPDVWKYSKNKVLAAVYRHERMRFEYERICGVLSESQIPFVPLKGSVIRPYYPEEWMRTSCDIDILVREEDLEHACSVLCQRLGYCSDGRKHFHDIWLRSDAGILLELHFNIKEYMEKVDGLLGCVWDYCEPCSEGSCEYRQTNEYLIFHLLAHMSYHFIHGGCGVRPFIDIWLIQRKMQYDKEQVRRFCAECGIENFYDSVMELAKVWFEDGTHTCLTMQMEEYIVSGGVYGSMTNKVAMQQAQSGSRLRNSIQRIILPYEQLKLLYPSLSTARYLTPFFQVVRWIHILCSGRFKSSLKELETNNRISSEQIDNVAGLLDGLGLSS